MRNQIPEDQMQLRSPVTFNPFKANAVNGVGDGRFVYFWINAYLISKNVQCGGGKR